MILMNQDNEIVTKKGKEVDFVFVYEVKNREIQGITLIAYELIRRGYKVGFVNTWHALHYDDMRYRAKVAVVFESYNTNVINFALSYIEHCDHVFNMQWEQILTDACLNEGSIYLLTGDAVKVYHASWGAANFKHLTQVCNIPEEQVRIVGHVGLDPAREKLKGYYRSKEDICKEFGIDSSKKLVLMISSFSNSDARGQAFKDFEKNSQQTISQWLIRYASENKNLYVIYRPHPAEVPTKEIREQLEKLDNISLISEYSIQQWVTISDIILNWWSTSMGDVFTAGKSCVLLRPYEIPPEHEYHMFRGAKKATTYDEMLKLIEENELPIPAEKVKEYYSFDDDKMAYEKIVDVLVELYDKEPTYVHECVKKKKLKETGFILPLRERYGYIKALIAKKMGRKNSLDEISYHLKMSKNFEASEKEIIAMMNRFRSVM